MARKIDYALKGEKIKAQVDALVQELKNAKGTPIYIKTTPKLSDIDLEKEDIQTLQQWQLRISKMIVEKSKQ